MTQPTHRLTILADLRRETGCETHDALMDYLQLERPLVADEAVHIADVPDSDLYSAWLKVSKGGL